MTFRADRIPGRGVTGVALAVVLLFVLSSMALGTAGRPTASLGRSAVGVQAVTNATDTLIATIDVAGGPTSLSAIFDPTNGYVYFGSNGTNLTAINGATNSVSEQIFLGPYASPATPNYVGGTVNDLYVPVISTDPPPDNVTVISGSTNLVVKYLSTGHLSYPTTGVFDPSNGYLYVPATGATLESHVTVINTATNTVVTTIPVGAFPNTPAYDPADGDIYVPNTYSSNNLSIIDASTNKVVGSIPITFPESSTITQEDLLTESPVYDPITQAVYQPDTGNATLTEIRGTTFVRNYTVGAGPQTPAVDPLNGNLFVPIAFVSTGLFGSANDSVSIVNVTSNVVTNVTVGESPETPVYDPVNNEMYVSCQVPSSSYGVVTALNATTGQVIATINVGETPLPPAFDSENDELYVPNFISNNVSVIAAGVYTGSGSGGGPGGSGGSATPAFLGLPGDDGYFLLGGVAAAVVVVAASVLYVRGHRPSKDSGGVTPWASPPPTGAWTPPPPPPPPPPPLPPPPPP